MIHASNKRSSKLLIAAGAQAAAQGVTRSALLTKLLPFAGAAGFVLRLFRQGRAETRPVAGSRRARLHQVRTQAEPRLKPGRTQAEPTPVKHPRGSMRTNLKMGGHSHE